MWILGDHEPTVTATTKAVTRHGAVVDSFVIPDSLSAQEVQTSFSDFAAGKMVDVIIDCTHLGELYPQTRRFDLLPETEAQALLFRSSLARFVVYKHLSGQGIRPTRIICLTASDGSLGLDAGQSFIDDPTFGALAGFYKGLRKEWIGCDVRIIDFARQALVDDLDGQLELLLAELEHTGLGVEVSYTHNLPTIPDKISIARKLIDWFVDQNPKKT